MDNIQGIYLAAVKKINDSFLITLEYKISNKKFVRLEYDLILNNCSIFKVINEKSPRETQKYRENEMLLKNNSFIIINLPTYSKSYYKENFSDEDITRYGLFMSNLMMTTLDKYRVFELLNLDNLIKDFEKFKYDENHRIFSIQSPKTNSVYIKYKSSAYGKFVYGTNTRAIKLYPTKNENNEITTKKYNYRDLSIADVDNEYGKFQFAIVDENTSIGDFIDAEFTDFKSLVDQLVDSIKDEYINEDQKKILKIAIKQNKRFTDSQRTLLLDKINEQNVLEEVLNRVIPEVLKDDVKRKGIIDEILKDNYADIVKRILSDGAKRKGIIDEILKDNYVYIMKMVLSDDVKRKGIIDEILKDNYVDIIKEVLSDDVKRKGIIDEILEDSYLEIAKEVIENYQKLNNCEKLYDEDESEMALARQFLSKLNDLVGTKEVEQQVEPSKEKIRLTKKPQPLHNQDSIYDDDYKKERLKREIELEQIDRMIEVKRNELRALEDEYSDGYRNVLDKAILEIEKRYEDSSYDMMATNTMLKISSNSELKNKLSSIRNDILSKKQSYIDYENAEDLVEAVEGFINTKSNRDISYNEVANILICISQGFLTIFAGEPGTGKTSLCNLIAKSVGLNTKDVNNRFLEISVEKGWTSKSDFIGYYNPLTRKFDTANSKVYEALTILNEEQKLKKDNQEFEEQPYLILLDEANLSPIEHYWADFMNVCDIDAEQEHEINLGEDNVYEVSNCLRFLATINYDHTTEMLSPRLIDRSWIILLDNNEELDFNSLVNKRVLNNEQTIKFDALEQFINKSNKSMPSSLSKKLKEIIDALDTQDIKVSPRVRKMIKNYCAVGENLFIKKSKSDLVVLDFAVAQKILPIIEGYGVDFREFLESFKENQLSNMKRCQAIVEKIISTGDRNMKHYQFFSR